MVFFRQKQQRHGKIGTLRPLQVNCPGASSQFFRVCYYILRVYSEDRDGLQSAKRRQHISSIITVVTIRNNFQSENKSSLQEAKKRRIGNCLTSRYRDSCRRLGDNENQRPGTDGTVELGNQEGTQQPFDDPAEPISDGYKGSAVSRSY